MSEHFNVLVCQSGANFRYFVYDYSVRLVVQYCIIYHKSISYGFYVKSGLISNYKCQINVVE